MRAHAPNTPSTTPHARLASLADASAVHRVSHHAPEHLPNLKARLLVALADLGAWRHPIDEELRSLLLLDPDLADWLDRNPHAL